MLNPVEALRQDGIYMEPHFMRTHRLCRQRFEADLQATDDTGKCKSVTDFADLGGEPRLLRWLSDYWNAPPVATTIAARRFLPSSINGYGAFQWHIDCTRPQVKAMLLLTDVGENDQRMDYIPGTHRENWSLRDYNTTRFTEEQARSYGEPLACIGPAGTLVLFDTNGLHRGNRTLGAIRDTITIYFEPRRSTWTIWPFWKRSGSRPSGK